ncbi:MAG: hypothetical protein GF334_03165 [Candidatus Altiarchaeales archaeon]|nr:hypothetical protein [Candidatus Altiarchaeales archaeon]
MLILKYRLQAGIILAILFAVLKITQVFLPQDYASYLRVAWVVWTLMLVALTASIIVKTSKWLFSVEKVQVPQEIMDVFDRFDDAISDLDRGQKDLQVDIQTAIDHQKTLMRLVVGFIEEARAVESKIERMKTGNKGKIAFDDPEFAGMLDALPDAGRQDSLETELGILEAQYEAFMRSAESLRNRIIEARAKIAANQVKLGQGQAAIPLLNMHRALGDADKRLFDLSQPTQKLLLN